MKISKLLFIVLFIASFTSTFSQKAYKIDDFMSYQKNHKIVAVVPIIISLDPKNMPRDLIVEDLDKLHESESMLLQDYFYASYLQGAQKEKLSCQIQDVRKTNTMLAANKVNYYNIIKTAKDEIAKFCEADATIVIYFYKSSQTFNEKVKNTVDLKVSIFDKSGLLLWEFYDIASENADKNHLFIEKELIEKILKKLPYHDEIKVEKTK
ncbi:MAG: hypothetical protein NTZ33_02755 [Bacteroidetes bacterium]|nr:hypothetical protein [Bacteroidota bacterium]